MYDVEPCARKLVEVMGDKITRYNGVLYCFDEHDGKWKTEKIKIDRYTTISMIDLFLAHHRDDRVFENGTSFNANGCGFSSKIAKVVRTARRLIPESGFLVEGVERAKHKLLFSDGIYDFDTNAFVEGFDERVVFFGGIGRKFPKTRDDTLVEYVNQKLFVEPFIGNDEGIYLRNMLCMAIAGYGVRAITIGIGFLCGHGTLMSAICSCFGGHVGFFEGSNMYRKDVVNRIWMRFILGVYRPKLIISDGITFSPKPTGGLQGVLMRELVDDEQIIFMLHTKKPKILDENEVGGMMRYVHYTKRFADNPVRENELLKIEKMREYMKSAEYSDALFLLFCDVFQEIRNGFVVPDGVMV